MSFITPGEALKNIRITLGITQKELSNIGISRNFISMFESNKRKLSEETSQKLVEMLKNTAIKKGINLDMDWEYLSIPSKAAAQAYCISKLSNNIDEADINELISLCKEYNFDSILYEVIIAKANNLYNKTKYREAHYYYQEALEMSIKLNKTNDLSMLYNKLGKCKLELHNFEEALIFFQKSYQYTTVYEDIICKKNSLFNIALAYKKLNMIEDALININQFIEMRNKEQFRDDFINAMILKANCYIAKNDYIAAINIYNEIKDIILDNSDPLLGYVFNNLGVAHLNLGNIEEALFNFDKCESLRRRIDIPSLSYTLVNKSEVFIKKKLFDEAIMLLNEGIGIANNFNDKSCIIKANLLFEEIYLNTNNVEKLENTYINMLELLTNMDDKDQIIIVLNKLSLLNINKGHIEVAKKYLEAAIETKR